MKLFLRIAKDDAPMSTSRVRTEGVQKVINHKFKVHRKMSLKENYILNFYSSKCGNLDIND